MLLQLPLEILEMIVGELTHRADINALVRTSRELHRRLNPYLYRLSADYDNSFNLLWAARVGQCGTARRWIAVMRDTPGMHRPETRYMHADATAALHEAIAHGQTELVRLLLTTVDGVDVNACDQPGGDTPLLAAVRAGQPAIVHLLLGWEGVDAQARDAAGHTTLFVAAMVACEAVVDLLLADGRADPNSAAFHGKTPLHAAVRRDGAGVVDKLLASGRVDADPADPNGTTPLIQATLEGHFDIVDRLLCTGRVDVGSRDKGGWTPLVAAVLHHNYALVRQLMECGAAVPSQVDQTPMLLFPTKVGDIAAVKMLLDAGVSPRPRDCCGRTVLSHAAELGDVEIVKLLLDASAGEDVNDRDTYGCPALFYATNNGHVAMVELLLAAGADPHIPSLTKRSRAPDCIRGCRYRPQE